MDEPLHVLILAGSPRPVSYSRGLARDIAGALRDQGARDEIFDLHETPLPPLDPAGRQAREAHPDPAAGRLYELAGRARAYVLVSPVYHNSYAGVLKNALDHLVIADFRYRVVGLASHGGRSTQAVDHLRQVVRGLNGVALPTQVCTGTADYGAEPDAAGLYHVTDPDLAARIARFAEELVRFARALAPLRETG